MGTLHQNSEKDVCQRVRWWMCLQHSFHERSSKEYLRCVLVLVLSFAVVKASGCRAARSNCSQFNTINSATGKAIPKHSEAAAQSGVATLSAPIIYYNSLTLRIPQKFFERFLWMDCSVRSPNLHT